MSVGDALRGGKFGISPNYDLMEFHVVVGLSGKEGNFVFILCLLFSYPNTKIFSQNTPIPKAKTVEYPFFNNLPLSALNIIYP